MKNVIRIWLASAGLLLAAQVYAQPRQGFKSDEPRPRVPVVQQGPDEQQFRAHIRQLASDEFAGRRPLTEYEPLTINYIADEFKRLGLEPVGGDSYFQDVPLLDVTTRVKGGTVTLRTPHGKVTLTDRENVVMWSGTQKQQVKFSNLDVVFAGFGIVAPEYGWNDYEGLDARGKLVVVLVNDPGCYDENLFQGKNMTYYGRWTYKFEEAARQGATAILVVHDTEPASYGWNVVLTSWSGNRIELVPDEGSTDVGLKGWITREKAGELMQAAGYSYDDLLQEALKPNFCSIDLRTKTSITLNQQYSTGTSHNVVARLPGTDLADECVVYSAHWDHFGIGRPVDGDSIYNGASDNASGVAALLTVAKKFTEMEQRPRRSMLFVAVTAEESGLLGSQYYAEHPLIPLEKTAVNINMDGMAPMSSTYDLFVGAMGYSTDVDRHVLVAAAAQGRRVIAMNESTSGGFFRSDHFNFAKVGIPVVLAMGGRERKDPNAPERPRGTYHQPQDEYSEEWDVSGSLDAIYLNVAIGLSIGNADALPGWSPDAPFQRR